MKNPKIAVTTCDTAGEEGSVLKMEGTIQEQPDQCQCDDASRKEEGRTLFRGFMVTFMKAKEKTPRSMEEPAVN